MSDKEQYITSKIMLSAFFIIWAILCIVVHVLNVYSPETAFFMTIIYLLIQGYNQTYRYKVISVPRYQDIINIADVIFIATTMWVVLAGLLVLIPLYFIFSLFIIICIGYKHVVKYCKKKSREDIEKSDRLKK